MQEVPFVGDLELIGETIVAGEVQSGGSAGQRAALPFGNAVNKDYAAYGNYYFYNRMNADDLL